MATEIRCNLEKALVSGSANCSQAERRDIGERIICFCRSATAARRCEQYVSLLRQNARFVFRKTTGVDSTLSNYQEICLQCGGLLGLASLSSTGSGDDDFDVSVLMAAVEDEHRGIERIPLDRIVPRIAAYNPRPHRKKK